MSVQINNGPIDLCEPQTEATVGVTQIVDHHELLSSQPRTARESFAGIMEDYDEEDFEESLLDKEKRRLEEESLKAARGAPKKPVIPVEEQ